MKSILTSVYLMLAILFASCNLSSDSDSITHFGVDMDQQFAWTDNPLPNLIVNDFAHSGKIVCKLDSITPYSTTLNIKKTEMLNKPFKEVVVSGYFFIKNTNSKPTFVIELKDSTTQLIELCSQEFKGENLKLNQWSYFEFPCSLTLNDRINKVGIYRIYGYNPSGETVLLDDMSVDFK
jgi:hypothetical protein